MEELNQQEKENALLQEGQLQHTEKQINLDFSKAMKCLACGRVIISDKQICGKKYDSWRCYQNYKGMLLKLKKRGNE
jgi:hypothetical protein